MRHASPLLVTGRLFEPSGGAGGGEVNRRESIPEETGNEANDTNGPTIVRPGRLLHAHARQSIQNTSTTQSHLSRPQRQPSNKQLPSHRKIRRWNNDRFIGTHSGTNNSAVHAALVTEGEDEWYQEYWMPNYPREYRSEFAKLVNDDSSKGVVVRERFLKGEVGSTGRGVHSNTNKMSRQFQGLSKTDVGNQLYRKLSPRIRSILSRCCDRTDMLKADDATNSTMAIRAINAFEAYITSCILQSKKSVIPSAGFPPLLSDEVYQIFDEIFCASPDMVLKKNKRKSTHGTAVVPSIHFYFADESNSDTKRNGAFYRILLYAVCNFHGLVASSSTLDGRKKHVMRKGLDKGVKVVTVQGGVVLGLDLKLLDFV
jgi:hypothetical protein